MSQKTLRSVWLVMIITVLPSAVRSLTGKVLLVSFDGFRWDYLDTVGGIKHFPRFAAEGTTAEYMTSTFTTLTFSTHYSMATGLYQESHGMVSNYMYDPVFNESFYPGCPTANDQKWWGGEPIWITATLQGKKAGSLFWIGSEVEFGGVLPFLWRKYDNSVPFHDRVDTVLDWFRYDGIDLGLVYFHQPDKAGHKYGPRSPEVAEQVRVVDGVLGHLMAGVASRGLESELNVIVVSDHGLTDVSPDRTLQIPDYVDWRLVDHFVEVGAICHLFAKSGRLDAIYRQLADAHPNMTVYRREEIPSHWHYSNNRRIGDLLLVMDEGWSCTENITFPWNKNKGSHGYDNRLLSMKPIFMARGPDIRRGHRVRPFSSLDIYPLTAALLGVRPAPNNGTLAIVQDMIRGYAPRMKPVLGAGGAVTNGAGTTLLGAGGAVTNGVGTTLLTGAAVLAWNCFA